MKVCITIDMEHDCPPYLTSYRGVEEGTPRLLELFAQEQVAATFLPPVTWPVAILKSSSRSSLAGMS